MPQLHERGSVPAQDVVLCSSVCGELGKYSRVEKCITIRIYCSFFSARFNLQFFSVFSSRVFERYVFLYIFISFQSFCCLTMDSIMDNSMVIYMIFDEVATKLRNCQNVSINIRQQFCTNTHIYLFYLFIIYQT